MLSGITREFSGANTTIACVITNAALSKAECSIVSGMAHDGYARFYPAGPYDNGWRCDFYNGFRRV